MSISGADDETGEEIIVIVFICSENTVQQNWSNSVQKPHQNGLNYFFGNKNC